MGTLFTQSGAFRKMLQRPPSLRRGDLRAAGKMSEHYRTSLEPRRLPGIPRLFDLVSQDGRFVGAAKYFSLVRGQRLPPARFKEVILWPRRSAN
jgi:hypothetical protein